VDAGRSWFRYHHLFTDLLKLQLRRTEPVEVTALHEVAARWFAGHGLPAEAIHHAQEAGNWALAARLLADHWPGLQLDGQAATVHVILAGFPAEVIMGDAELATVAAADELAQGSLEAAERYLRLAERGFEAPTAARPGRRGQAQLLLGMVRLPRPRPALPRPAHRRAAAQLPQRARPPGEVAVADAARRRTGRPGPRRCPGRCDRRTGSSRIP
jgi:LuxR family maltose regulon positive regulatory protein